MRARHVVVLSAAKRKIVILSGANGYPRSRVLLVLSLMISSPLSAQSLADRVGAVGTGAVNFHYTGRAGICGDGERFMKIGSSHFGSVWKDMHAAPCDFGPVQVRLTVRDGSVERVETWAGTLRSRDGRDLGAVPASTAARFLLEVAARPSGSGSAKAILPAVLADSATVWPTLLQIARTVGSTATRNEALFWLSRFAGGAIAGQPNDPIDADDDKDRDDLKTHAVFVLSQLPHREGVPTLLEIARGKGDRHVRRQALFWLGQSGDARAIDLFESLLKS